MDKRFAPSNLHEQLERRYLSPKSIQDNPGQSAPQIIYFIEKN